MSELELTPDQARAEDALRRAGPLVEDGARRLLAGATSAATTPARDLQGLIEQHADEALAFLEALTGDPVLAQDVLEEALALVEPPLDLADLLGLARVRVTRRLATMRKGRVGPLDLPADVCALLLLRHGLGLSTEQLARAGEARPGTALAQAAAHLERAVPTPTHPDSAELARLLARDVADVGDAGDRARLAALTLDPALAPTVVRVRAALSVPVAVVPDGLRARVEARRASDRARDRIGPRVALRCTYCHGDLSGDDSCHCAACLAPHHLDCFEAHGGCGVHGCGEARSVRAGGPPAGPVPTRSPWWGVAAGALGGALVTAAAFLAAGPRGAVVAPPAAPVVEAPPVAPPAPLQETPGPAPAAESIARELAELREVTRAPAPDWKGVAMQLAALEPRADASTRGELRQLIDQCFDEMRDEELYVEAQDIVAARVVDRYPEALQRLSRIKTRSRIHPDALAYIKWIQADTDVREAERAYAMGDERRAFELLARALDTDVLGPEARTSVRQRRTAWARVVAAYMAGQTHVLDGRTRDAEEELRRVLELEPDPANRFHARAKGTLEHLEAMRTGSRETRLRDGLDALEAGRLDSANQHFSDVARDRTVTPGDLARIREAVAAAAQTRRLLARASEDFRHDRSERFLDAYYAMKLLVRWLPAGHPERGEAKKLQASLVERLKMLEDSAEKEHLDEDR